VRQIAWPWQTTSDLARWAVKYAGGEAPMLDLILLIVLIVLLVGAVPTWPHSRSWGYYPSGGLGLILVIVIILLLLGYIPLS
jgi:hypothetical protein